jgi:hypothetical protein
MSALVAAAVAYRIDQKERPGIRWQDTAFVGLACAFWAIPVVFLLHDACDCSVPPYLRVTIVSAVTGATIGFLIPTLHRSPITTVSRYEHFKIVVTTLTDPDGEVRAAIRVLPPELSGHSAKGAEQLPLVTASSTDDAIAEAVRSARVWISERRQQSEAPLSKLTSAAKPCVDAKSRSRSIDAFA